MATTADNQRWSQAWASALRALDLLAGKSTATAGSRIRRMEVSLGQVTAEVQERTHGLCQITITVEPLPEQAWLQVLEMFQQQVAGAPSIDPRTAFPENEAAFHRFCALIFPNRRQDLQSSCSCCAGDERACPALQAVYRQLGAMLDEEPVLLLRLRGREWQQVVQALQNQRSTSFHGPATTNGHLRTISQFEGHGPARTCSL
ncbi:MAG: hypothetical protein R2932_27045 [Caldilineaceae bacterium]